MNRAEFETWKAEHGTGNSEFFYCNGLTWVFTHLPDGWIGVWECRNGNFQPRIQAKDESAARSWCVMIEPLPVGVDVIC